MQPAAQPSSSHAHLWVLTDHVVGHTSQSLGVAEALGLPFEQRELAYGSLAALPWSLGARSLAGLTAESRQKLAPPWPRLVIAAGRRLGAVARWIKRRAARDGRSTRLVQIMDPVAARDAFDLIAAPRHDAMTPGPTVIETLGAPNRITQARLSEEASRWRDRLADLPSPRFALLVGGATRHHGFAPAVAAELGRLASDLARSAGGGLLITTSRRTGAAATEALIDAVRAPSFVHRWDAGGGDNPYFAFLGLCDAAIVTGESISMCSEACATGRPVYIFAPPSIIKPAFAAFHAQLYQSGMAQPLDQSTTRAFTPWFYPPLSAAEEVAAAIRARGLLSS